jgi:hypothetical protein
MRNLKLLHAPWIPRAWHGREVMQTLQPAAVRRHIFSTNEAKLVSLFNTAAWYARSVDLPYLRSIVLGGGLVAYGGRRTGNGESQAECFRNGHLKSM